jgi:trigger factor
MDWHGIVARVPVAVTTTPLPDSRVRLQVQVPAGELEGRVERTARRLGGKLKLPGFRRGKVPAPLVIQRIGREAVLEETVREGLSNWYSDAIETAGITPVGDPQLALGELPAEGEALEFAIEIGVLPAAQLGSYEGLKVARREPNVGDEEVEREIDAMRERLARLKTAERPAGKDDFLVVDYVGSLIDADASGEQGAERAPAGEGRDELLELGVSNLIPGLEERLLGARAGETRTIELSFPGDHANRELAGRRASFTFTVKEVKVKELPAVDEDLAIDAGFDSLEELREDIRRRLLVIEEGRIEGEYLRAALDAAVAEARVELPPELVKARAREMWERTLRSLSQRGISREGYLLSDRQPADLQPAESESLAARREQEILAEIEPEAEQALRREAVLTAIVAAEGIEPSEEELLEALSPVAERDGVEPEKLLAELRKGGRLEDVREDLAARKAVELIAARATPIPVAEAQAKERLWTPAKAREQREAATASGGLWTPDR